MRFKGLQEYIDCIRNKKYKRMFETIEWLEKNDNISSQVFEEIKHHKKNFLFPKAQYLNLKNKLQKFLDTIDATKLNPAKGELRTLQIKLLNFAKNLIPQLESEGIYPLLSSGNLIGAVRHKGFVPWDDDLDFDLMRDEFNKLREIAKNKFFMFDKEKITGFDMFYSELKKYWNIHPDSIVFIEKPSCISAFLGSNLKNCVVIDFFPRDYVNENLTKDKYLEYRNQNLSKFEKLNNWITTFDIMDKELARNDIYVPSSNITALGWGNVNFEWGKVSFLDINAIKPYRRIKFEDTEFYTINDINNYLTDFYGNYMNIPAEMEIAKYTNDFKKVDETKN